jgi:hypothetical protein
VLGISKNRMLAFFNTFVSFSCENWQVPTGYYGNFIIKRRRLFLHLPSPGGSRRALSDSDPLSLPAPGVDFHLTQAHEKAKKVDDMLWGPCDADCSRHPPVLFRVCWTLDYRLQHRCGESVARIPEFMHFLLFCYFNTSVCVFQRGGTPAACMLHTCVRGGGGEGEGSGSLRRGVLAKFAALAWSPSFPSCHLYSSSTCLLFSMSEISLVFLASTHIFQKASALHYH